ncbi:oxidoreductase [Hortaea werneckii]|nr:oxidoreductase [Hortaea werneckii]KAI7509028.1 oxidoreductase [Hortaea werneckii]
MNAHSASKEKLDSLPTGENPNASDGPSAFEKPPEWIKTFYKRYQKLGKYEDVIGSDLVDLGARPESCSRLSVQECSGDVARELGELHQKFSKFLGRCMDCGELDYSCEHSERKPASVFALDQIPGLFIYPNLLPPHVQSDLLNKLLHRDLANPKHQTNVHLHYNVSYPPTHHDTDEAGSFFDHAAKGLDYRPKESHAAISTERFLDKKLRWITLGGQYDWTAKQYPPEVPPDFPSDIKDLVEDLFPMKAEAAIVNLYGPGDVLSVHRDVSEECAQPLVSISVGCDAIFICGLESQEKDPDHGRIAAIRLRSGDALLMSGESRYAWHGVPKVLPDTCPHWLQDWPAVGEHAERFRDYKGWMKRKRINLNVRQMFASEANGDTAHGKTSMPNHG